MKLLNNSNIEKRQLYYQGNQRILLNVGGFKFEVLWKTLDSFPCSRLGKLKKNLNNEYLYNLCDDFDRDKLEFFFDRDPTLFNFILNYYRDGKLHINENICPNLLQSELNYWEIDEPNMDLYCEEKLCQKQQAINSLVENYVKIFNKEKHKIEEINILNSTRIRVVKNKIWNLLENPFEIGSSFISKVLNFILLKL